MTRICCWGEPSVGCWDGTKQSIGDGGSRLMKCEHFYISFLGARGMYPPESLGLGRRCFRNIWRNDDSCPNTVSPQQLRVTNSTQSRTPQLVNQIHDLQYSWFQSWLFSVSSFSFVFLFLLLRWLECPNISGISLRKIGTHENGVLGKNPGKPGGPSPTQGVSRKHPERSWTNELLFLFNEFNHIFYLMR